MAEGRANLIREMAGSRKSVSISGSEGGSVRDLPAGGGWDTESQQLPVTRPDPDFQINTSALRRAFPDFSQHGSSEEDSVEVGRGYRSSTRNTPSRNLPSEEVSEVMPFTFSNGSRYRLTGTPPIRPRKSNSQLNNARKDAAGQALAGKENEDPKKETRTGSASSGRASHDSRKTLVDRHATVESDNESMHIDKLQRPAVINTPGHSTRFGSMRVKPGTPAATGPARQALEQIVQNAVKPSGSNGTYQSFILPDMPNITELISGERRDGTPLFNRSVKSHSRFATPANTRRATSQRVSHAPVELVPIPAEVKALYVSLQLLQEKVETLEAEKAKAEQKNEENELEFLQLKSKVEEQDHARNRDSGIEADVGEAKVRDLEGVKSRLESSLRTLQERLDRANRKIVKSEAQVSSLTKDRDALHKRLGVVYLDSKEQEDTRVLNSELQRLQAELNRVTRNHQKQINQLARQEAELRGKIERREKAINQMASLAKELFNTRNALAEFEETGALAQDVPAKNLRTGKTMQRPQTSDAVEKHAQRSTKRRSFVTSAIENDKENDLENGVSDAESTTHIRFDRRVHSKHQLTVDSDFLSFMDGDEVAKLKHIVDEDKAKLARTGGESADQLTDYDVTNRSKFVPRRSSMKKVSYGELTQESVRSEQSARTRDHTERQNTQLSNNTQTSERRRRSAAQRSEQTSAFILPDITLRGGQAKDDKSNHEVQATAKQKTTITRPIPISDRVPETLDETVRPAHDPAIALATVLRGLEDEIIRLRAELAEQESLYHAHDPALSKRKRKIVHSRMQKLLAVIETRCDQVYALYDVLEGQKASGQMMKENEVEITLLDLGIDVEAVKGSGTMKTVRAEMEAENSDEDLESESDGDLPAWEGFEPTATQTLDALGRISVR